MRGSRAVLVVAMLLVALAGTAAAQSPSPPVDVFAGRLPEEVAGEPLYRMPKEVEDVVADQLLASTSATGVDMGALFSVVGVDVATAPVAASTNLDLQPFLDAEETGTFTEADRAAVDTWANTEGLMVVAFWLGEEGPVDHFFDMFDVGIAASRENDADALTVAGRRVVDFTPSLAGDSGTELAWVGLVGVGDMLYVVASRDDEPTLLQTVAAIPVPED